MALIVVPTGASQTLNSSRNNVASNFQVISNDFAVDHVAYNTTGEGKHNKVTLPVQSAAPTFTGSDDGLYNLLNATTNLNELYVHKQTNAGTNDIPMTASILSTTTIANNDVPGWTMLPSGILMRWLTCSGTGLITVALPSGPIPFNAIHTVLLTPWNPSGSDANFAVRLVSIITNSQFSVYFSSRTSTGAAAGAARVLVIGS